MSDDPLDDLEKILRAIIKIRRLEEPTLIDAKIEAIRVKWERIRERADAPSKSMYADYLHREMQRRGLSRDDLSLAGISKGSVLRALERHNPGGELRATDWG